MCNYSKEFSVDWGTNVGRVRHKCRSHPAEFCLVFIFLLSNQRISRLATDLIQPAPCWMSEIRGVCIARNMPYTCSTCGVQVEDGTADPSMCVSSIQWNETQLWHTTESRLRMAEGTIFLTWICFTTYNCTLKFCVWFLCLYTAPLKSQQLNMDVLK